MSYRTLIGTKLDTAGSYLEGAVPVDGDTVILPKGNVVVDPSTLGAFSGFASGITLIVQPGCGYTVGDASTPLNTKIIAAQISGSGFTLVQTGNSDKVAVLSSGAQVTLQGGTHSKLSAVAGRVVFGAGANVGDVTVGGAGQVVIPASSGSDRVDNLYQFGGAVECARMVSLARVAAGLLRMTGSGSFQDGSSGGRLDLLGDAARVVMENTAAATIDLMYGYAGELDPSLMTGALTITNCHRHARLRLKERYAGGTIAFTNTPTDFGYQTNWSGAGAIS